MLFILPSCYSSYYVENYNSTKEYFEYINEKSIDETIVLKLLNGEQIRGDRLFINKEITSIYLDDTTSFNIKTDSVHQIILNKHSGGLFYGLLIGLGTGYLMGKVLYSEPEAQLAQLFIISLGTVVGGGIGYLIGNKIKFEINKK